MEFFKTNTWIWYPVLALLAWYAFFHDSTPCASTITYRIGTFDKRFDISQATFLESLKKASDIWNEATGKTVFKYDPKGKLVINLTYDIRQKSTQETLALEANIDKLKDSAKSVKTQYQALEGGLSAKKQEYTEMSATFNEHQKAYTDQVTYWNERGGAPVDAYAKLGAQRESLLQEQSALETKVESINASVDEINDFIRKYNLILDDARTDVNTINSGAGKQFEQGYYEPTTNSISIFEFKSNRNLTRVIAHELGHALTLQHTTNPASIMYPVNRGENLTLSNEDIAELKRVCHLR